MNTRPLLASVAIAMVGFSLISHACRADVIFDTFGTNNTFSPFGAIVSGSGASGNNMLSEADRFTAAFSGGITQIAVAVNIDNRVSASAGFIDLSIALNNPVTNLPLVTSALALGTIQATSTAPAILSLTPTAPYVFAAGSTYWLILAPHDSTTVTYWERASDPNATASAFMSVTSGGVFQSNGAGAANAFRISATPVPEPATWMLLGVGLPACWLLRPRRHSAR